MHCLSRVARNSLILVMSLALVISIFSCGEDDTVSPDGSGIAARVGIVMAPHLPTDGITSARLIVTATDIERVELDLPIDQEGRSATGSVNLPPGDNRLLSAEVYAGSNLRFVGEQQMNIRKDEFVEIHVRIRPASGVNVISISDQTEGKGLMMAAGDSDIFLSEGTKNRNFIINISNWAGPNARLKFDISHGTMLSSQEVLSIEDLFAKNGFQVNRDDSLEFDRNVYEVIFIVLPVTSFSAGEVNSIAQFVQSGGTLVLVADTDAPLEFVNPIADEFGIEFEYSLVSIPDGDPGSLSLSDFSTHPLFDGISEIKASHARSLKVVSEAAQKDIYTHIAATPGPDAVTIPDQPRLAVSDLELNLTEDLDSVTFYVKNIGTGTLNWRVSTDVDWLSLEPSSGATETEDPVKAIIDRSKLAEGKSSAVIKIEAERVTQTATVVVQVAVPELSVNPDTLDFDVSLESGQISIENTGGGDLSWEIADDLPGWLDVSPTSGRNSSGARKTISVNVNRSDLESGTYSHVLPITSNGGEEVVSVAMTVPQPLPLISISPASLDFGTVNTSSSIIIKNSGGMTLDWNIDDDLPEWLNVSPISGQNASGEDRTVSVNVSRQDLIPGAYKHNVSVTSNGGNRDILVTMEVPEQPPSLSLSPISLDFGEEDASGSFTITNGGEQTLAWDLVSDLPGWLRASPTSGELSSGISSVSVIADRSDLDPGTYRHAISVTSNGGSGSVWVTMEVPEPEPSLSVSPESLDFGTEITELSFTISNSGGQTLEWSITYDLPGWLEISPTDGQNSSGDQKSISVSVDRSGLDPGTYRHTVSVTSNGGSDSVSVTMEVPEPEPSLSLSPGYLDFGEELTKLSFTIGNTGGQVLDWSIVPDLPGWLRIFTTSGEISSGGTGNISVNVSRSDMDPGVHTHTISVTSNGGYGNVFVTMEVSEPEPSLLISPRSLDFGTELTELSFTITNSGGQILEWDIQYTTFPGWLKASPLEGEIPLGGSTSVLVTVSRAGLEPRIYGHAIVVKSNGGTDFVLATMTVAESLSDLEYQVQVGSSFVLAARAMPGTGYEWLLEFDSGMLELVHGQFVSDSPLIGGPGTQLFEFMGLREGLTGIRMIYKQPWEAQIFDEQIIGVEVLPVSDRPLLSLSPKSLEVSDTGLFVISNSGNGVLQWSIVPDLPGWLNASPMNGDVLFRKRDMVWVNVDIEALRPGTYKHTISVKSNAGSSSLSVTVIAR